MYKDTKKYLRNYWKQLVGILLFTSLGFFISFPINIYFGDKLLKGSHLSSCTHSLSYLLDRKSTNWNLYESADYNNGIFDIGKCKFTKIDMDYKLDSLVAKYSEDLKQLDILGQKTDDYREIRKQLGEYEPKNKDLNIYKQKLFDISKDEKILTFTTEKEILIHSYEFGIELTDEYNLAYENLKQKLSNDKEGVKSLLQAEETAAYRNSNNNIVYGTFLVSVPLLLMVLFFLVGKFIPNDKTKFTFNSLSLGALFSLILFVAVSIAQFFNM